MATSGLTVSIDEETPQAWWDAEKSIGAATAPEKWDSHQPSWDETIWLVARRGGQVVGTCRGQRAPAQAAAVFAPTLLDGEPLATGRVLLESLEEKLARTLAPRRLHALTSSERQQDAEVMKAAGFREVGEVLHMSCSTEFPSATVEPRLKFEAFVDSTAGRSRLERVFDQTCRDTDDLPQLDCLADGSSLLDGFREVGRFRAELWQIANRQSADVGCVLVNPLDQPEVCQLVYCGLCPELRNRGLGVELVRFGQRLAREHGAGQMVLSVDGSNTAAIRAYGSAGLCITGRNRLMMKRAATTD